FYEKNNGNDEDGLPILEDIEVQGAETKELPSGTTSVTWDNLPRYDADGNEYSYLVKEYVMVEDELVAAAPDGYVKTEDGLTVTNTKSESYNPKTTYTGTKIWVDTANNGATRPEMLHVTLYANGAPTDHVAQWTKGTGDKANEWTYTFSDLPVFDENGAAIRYTAVETPVNGYVPDPPVVTQTSYQILADQDDPSPIERVTECDNLDITIASETDLAYIAIKKNAHSHLIWTQRAISEAEKQKLYADINNVSGFIGEMKDTTVTFINGLPVHQAFEGGTVTITKTSNTVMHADFTKQNVWAQLCYGSYKYEYAPGTTSFTNSLRTVTVDAQKALVNASGAAMTPPDGTTATFDLFIGDVQQNRPVVLNGKTDVEQLSEDENVAKTQEVNATALAAKAYESEPWKAFWADLAEYDTHGELITYTVKEVTVASGFANQNADGVSPGGTITNKQVETEINILKVDYVSSKALTGAKFRLELYDDGYHQILKTWDEVEVSAEEGKKGTLKFEGLSIGKYKLIETDSPDGYILMTEPPQFEVVSDAEDNLSVVFTNTDLVTYDQASNVFTVRNIPGAALPSTGGLGTGIIYTMGMVLIGIASILLAIRKSVR
ncbi:MAG: Cna B-type domain-containing protein, partial [Eubacteriales bacterium]|nr:Cna B-type domain-containing protein [Eubacteriales bacterium]